MHATCRFDSPRREFDSGENEALRRDVRLLGELLGQTVAKQHGAAQLQLIEEVRAIAKRAQLGEADATRQLIDKVIDIVSRTIVAIGARVHLVLNLANIAEQHHQIRQRRQTLCTADANGALPQSVIDAELEKTAHRRRIARATARASRTVVDKHRVDRASDRGGAPQCIGEILRIARLLGEQDRADLSGLERAQIITALARRLAKCGRPMKFAAADRRRWMKPR